MNRYVRPELFLKVLEQVDDLRLDRDVERRDGLVGDDELRVDGQRPRDADALALAPGELVRIAVRVVRLQAHEPQQFADALFGGSFRLRDAVDRERLADDVADASCADSARRTDPGR